MPFVEIDIKAMIEENMRDPEFAKYFKKYQLEYELIAQIVSFRKQRNITQQELAELSGVKQQVISRMERHQAFPNLTTLAKIANALGLQLTFKAINPN